MKKSIKRIISIAVAVCLSFAFLPSLPITAAAEATGLTMEQLREKFPDGKYWNHADNPGASNAVNNQDSYTSTPCPRHGTIGTSSQTCNGFQPEGKQFSWQCMGYAEKLGYDATGFNPRENANGWYTNKSISALDSLKPGDIVRYRNDTHSIYITAVDGETVTYTDCNSDGHCGIAWDETVTMTKLKASFTYVRVAPSAMAVVRPSCGCSEDYAGTYLCNTASTSLNIRSGHGTNYGIVGSIPKNATVTVTMASGTGSDDWAHVSYNGITGYACAAYLKLLEPAKDTTGPTVSNVQVTNVDKDGYTVSCTVTDPSGIDRVQFPTWTLYNGQDDLPAKWPTGTADGSTYTYRVNIADHNYEGGQYMTHIYAYDTCGNSSVVDVDPVEITIPATNLTLDVNTLSFDTLGDTYQLSATVGPVNATDKTVSWQTDAPAVATVQDGLVTVIGYGIAQITVKTANGISATCTVTVTKKLVLPQIVTQPQSVTADRGDAVTFCVDAVGEVVSYKWEYRKSISGTVPPWKALIRIL